LYPTTEKKHSFASQNGGNLLRCIPQQKKTLPLYSTTEKSSSMVSHNGKKTLNLNNFAKINFSANDFNHESGSQEDQFDEKKWRPKISWYYPFK
jgi:hypothetical protein